MKGGPIQLVAAGSNSKQTPKVDLIGGSVLMPNLMASVGFGELWKKLTEEKGLAAVWKTTSCAILHKATGEVVGLLPIGPEQAKTLLHTPGNGWPDGLWIAFLNTLAACEEFEPSGKGSESMAGGYKLPKKGQKVAIDVETKSPAGKPVMAVVFGPAKIQPGEATTLGSIDQVVEGQKSIKEHFVEAAVEQMVKEQEAWVTQPPQASVTAQTLLIPVDVAKALSLPFEQFHNMAKVALFELENQGLPLPTGGELDTALQKWAAVGKKETVAQQHSDAPNFKVQGLGMPMIGEEISAPTGAFRLMALVSLASMKLFATPKGYTRQQIAENAVLSSTAFVPGLFFMRVPMPDGSMPSYVLTEEGLPIGRLMGILQTGPAVMELVVHSPIENVAIGALHELLNDGKLLGIEQTEKLALIDGNAGLVIKIIAAAPPGLGMIMPPKFVGVDYAKIEDNVLAKLSKWDPLPYPHKGVVKTLNFVNLYGATSDHLDLFAKDKGLKEGDILVTPQELAVVTEDVVVQMAAATPELQAKVKTALSQLIKTGVTAMSQFHDALAKNALAFPPVALKSAIMLLQPVTGTAPASPHYYVVAMRPGLNVAARFVGDKLSLRIEGSQLETIKARLAQSGVFGHQATHASAHLNVSGLQAEMAFGAALAIASPDGTWDCEVSLNQLLSALSKKAA